MQIDFHHAVTYVVARFAGFSHAKAETIAYAAQYVDDSTETGYVRFDNEMRFYRQATSHPVYDPDNMDDDTDAESWLPFHFLPGNGGLDAGKTPPGPYIRKLVCRPGSPVAQAMAECALADRDSPWGLHRLGIVAHVFADTWAHQGFVGLNDDINSAAAFEDANGNSIPVVPLPLPPVGHGQARHFPDQPWLVWSYQDADGKRVTRDNPADFLTAADELCKLFQRWQQKTAAGLSPSQKQAISECFASFTDEDEKIRHRSWLKAIAAGKFAFGSEELEYDAERWKNEALGNKYTRGLLNLAKQGYPYAEGFVSSDWKLFHDAARCQRHDVFVRVLPAFHILEN
ncbi:MAG: DUF6765 family protein [Bacteroidales bacterium]